MKHLIGLLLLTATITFDVIATPVVAVANVESLSLSPTLPVTGRVSSRSQSSITADISGKLEWVVEPGTRVAAGDILARIESRPYELAVKQLEAKLARKRVELNKMTRDQERMEALSHLQSISEKQLDEASATVEMARADYDLLTIELESAEDDLEKTRLHAPFSGVVTARQQNTGESVSATQAIVTLTDNTNLEVVISAPLKFSQVTALSEALTVHKQNRSMMLPLRATIPVSDDYSQTFTAYLTVPEPLKSKFMIGELVSVSVPTAKAVTVMAVPRDALVISQKGISVYVLDEKDKAREVLVTLGEESGDMVAVEGNLSVKDKVVVRGGDRLKHGQVVRVLTTNEFPLAS